MISLVPPPICFTGQLCCPLLLFYLFALLFVHFCLCSVTNLLVVHTHFCPCGCKRCLRVSNKCFFCSSSYGKRLDDPTVTSASTGTSSAGLSRLNSILAQRYFIKRHFCPHHFPHLYKMPGSDFLFLSHRLSQEPTEKNDPSATTTSSSQSTATAEQETKQRRKWVSVAALWVAHGRIFEMVGLMLLYD